LNPGISRWTQLKLTDEIREHLGLRRERSDFGETFGDRSVEPLNAYLDLPQLASTSLGNTLGNTLGNMLGV
jgi:ABC-type transporter lipoprotein component MlaA